MSILAKIRRRRAVNGIDCSGVAAVLQSFLDGELDASNAKLVAAHLDMCRDCGLDASVYANVKGALADRGNIPHESVERLREFAARIVAGDITDGDGDGDEIVGGEY